MNADRDLGDNDRIPQSFWHPALEIQPEQVLQGNGFVEHKDGTEQDRNMEYASTSQPRLEDSDSQIIKVEDDPKLAPIAAQLRETASHAINPTFKEELRKKLLQQFVAHHTGVSRESL